MDLVARLPWWGGLALALFIYVLLHMLATPPKTTVLANGRITDLIAPSIVSALAYGGQFALPPLCVLAAFVSFLRQRKRASLLTHVTQSKSADALNGMSWQEFEMLVGQAFRVQGYQVVETGGAGADGGVDLVLRKGGETWLVQCKQWKAFKVDVKVVRELYGVMAARGAAGGFVITSGTFTADAGGFAEGRNVRLIDGARLHALIQQGKIANAMGETPTAARVTPVEEAVPRCPKCAASMVRRTAKNGVNAGSQFWGCSTYPACRGTR